MRGLLLCYCPLLVSSFLFPFTKEAPTSQTERLAAATSTTIPSSKSAIKTFRDEIILLLTRLQMEDIEREQAMAGGQRLDFVISQLEQGYVPPQTLPFMNLLLEGTWINIYNSWAWTKKLKSLPPRTPLADLVDDDELTDYTRISSESKEAVQLRSLTQHITTNQTFGSVINQAEWRYVHQDDAGLMGSLIIRSQYEVNSRGIMEQGSSVEHDLRLVRAPKNPEALIKGVQKVTPFDLFDPNATFVETAFIDHELRVTKTHSTRFGSITNIFVRNGTALQTHLQECGSC